MGVEIVITEPDNADKIWLGDIDLSAFNRALTAFDQPLPSQLAVAVQDHGFSTTESNNTLRFSLWKEFIAKGGFLKDLIFTDQIPEVYTRMKAIRAEVPNAILTDTGTAAIRGHRVYGLLEHHTKCLNTELLASLVKKMQTNELTNDEIYNTGGHGAVFHQDMCPGWDYVAVTGPQRNMVESLGWHEVAPYGDMMLTGCFGILAGLDII